MILIHRTDTDPFFNIAAEEYVLKHIDEDAFMLWISTPSVIVGKHQVAVAEANVTYTHRHNIPVIRRISGGGTVYHDEGNLNYSLVVRGEKGRLVDYRKYSSTIINALRKCGLNASLEGKSNLVVDGLKFSGNAEHVYRDRVLHHGTILFDSDLKQLRKCIRPQHDHYDDRSVRSKDSLIVNLRDLLPSGTTMQDLAAMITAQAREELPVSGEYRFSDHDRDQIGMLVETKYATDDWNYGYSPPYSIRRTIGTDDGNTELFIEVRKGMINGIRTATNNPAGLGPLLQALSGKRHQPVILEQVLEGIDLRDSLPGMSKKALLEWFF